MASGSPTGWTTSWNTFLIAGRPSCFLHKKMNVFMPVCRFTCSQLFSFEAQIWTLKYYLRTWLVPSKVLYGMKFFSWKHFFYHITTFFPWKYLWKRIKLPSKGDQRVGESTAIKVYLCIERSESGAKGTPRILGGGPISGNLFYSWKSSQKTNDHTLFWCFKPSYWPNVRQSPLKGFEQHATSSWKPNSAVLSCTL